MACSNCSPEGCGNKGHCASGGCNKMNTYDWINTLDISDPDMYQYIEVSFKNGSRKDFYICDDNIYQYHTGDLVVVDCSPGYDVGQITLMGELVRMQMKKKNVYENKISHRVIRKANERDLEKLEEARKLDQMHLVKARAIARSLGIDMKLGDIEYQADLKKATYFYTANGRVDFRELVREYAREFRIKVEMRQIGSRQESARIGGLGSCGRELCCSTWLSDFKSVNTSAARYQNISINQTKLSGQCGRLKCCLNYELDTYLDALQHFPERADVLMTKKGKANLMKTDIFKGLLYYSYEDIAYRGAFHPIDKEKVKEIQALNAKGVHIDDLAAFSLVIEVDNEEKEIEFEDVTGQIELPSLEKSNRRGKSSRNRRRGDNASSNNSDKDSKQRSPRGPKPSNKSSAPKSANTRSKNNNDSPKSQGEKPNMTNKPEHSKPNQQSNKKGRGNKKRFKGKGH